MAYVTNEDVAAAVGGQVRLGEIMGNDELKMFIDVASAEADARMGVSGNIVPLADPIAVNRIKGPLLDIIVYRIKARKQLATDFDQTAFEKGIQFFRDVAAGNVKLSLTAPTESRGYRFTSETPVFSREALKDY